MNKGDRVAFSDANGNLYVRVIKSIHYPSTIDGRDCLVIYLEPVGDE